MIRVCRTHLISWDDAELSGCWYVDRHGVRCNDRGTAGSVHVVGRVYLPAPPDDAPTHEIPAGQ